MLKIKNLIEVGEISPPLKATAWYSNGLYNNGAHIINLLNFWLGDAFSLYHPAGRKLNDLTLNQISKLFLTEVQ